MGSEPLYFVGITGTVALDDTASGIGEHVVPATMVNLAPAYHGMLFVRGAELGGGQPLSFVTRDRSAEELYFESTIGEEQAGAPGLVTWTVGIEVPGPGCYGLQVEGVGHFGGYVVVFEVE